MDVDRKRADWPHWPDRGNGPVNRDRLERRLFRDSEREAEIEQARGVIRQIELAAAEKAAQVEHLERAVAATNGIEKPPAAADTAAAPRISSGYVVFVCSPYGYRLLALDGELPGPGSRIVVDNVEAVVAKLGPSPLPGDVRRCAYLDPV
jgi:hypothetical protein